MEREDFIENFQEWRKSNGLPKREECREIFRDYRDCHHDKPINKCFEYILKQDKPARFLDSLFKKDSEIQRDFEKEAINACFNFIQENKYLPRFSVLNNIVGFKINKYFDTEKDLFDECSKQYPEVQDFIFNENSFGYEYEEELKKQIKSHKTFFITSAVSGKKINQQLLSSIKNYINRNNALCLILPCEDRLNRKSVYNWQLSPELKQDNFYVVYNDTYLNSNIYMSDIKVSAKQINPQSGLPQFTQEGSVIIASPKQDLEFIANSNKKLANAIMTTGAITENDYSNDAFMSQRLNKIAEYEHILGGIIVEVENDKIFHFRQVQMGSDGEIIDLGIKYTPDNKTSLVEGSVMVVGDSHFGEEDKEVINKEKDIIDFLGIQHLVMHDVFTGTSVSHWNSKKTITSAISAKENKISLKDEAEMTAQMIDNFAECVDDIVIPYSNHHVFLDRYLEDGKYAFDKVNLRYCLDIVKAMIDGETLPVRYMLENQTNFKNANKVKWLEPNDDFDYYSIEISQHGQLGSNGARGNLATYRKAYKKSMSAHTHSARIYRGAISVGTSTKMQLGYNLGLSSWTNTCGVIYPNGTYQLINIINKDGNYTWKL